MSRFMNSRLCGLSPYTPGEQLALPGLLKLNTNESPYPPSPAVVRAIDTARIEALNLYPDPSATLLTGAIAERYGVRNDQVLAGNGSDEILSFAFQAFTEYGAVFPDITYGFYPVWCALYNIPYRTVPLMADYTIAPAAYAGGAAMAVIANPNAPTGIALPLSAIRAILDSHPGPVLVDEAYVDFGAQSAASLLPLYENLLIVQTFSKSRSLAGGRIGFALGSPGLIADLNRIRCSFHPYNLNSLSILAGAAAVKDEEYFDVCRRAIMADREFAAAALRGLGFEVLPSQANFVFARHPAMGGAELYRMLRARGILVRHFAGPRVEDYNRISIGTRVQMERLADTLSTLIKGA
jgi:histidinol-phosphate aminotransferase